MQLKPKVAEVLSEEERERVHQDLSELLGMRLSARERFLVTRLCLALVERDCKELVEP